VTGVETAVKGIMADPLLGEAKAGALRAICVHKLKVGPLQLLLAYHFHEQRSVIAAWAVGPSRTSTAISRTTCR